MYHDTVQPTPTTNDLRLLAPIPRILVVDADDDTRELYRQSFHSVDQRLREGVTSVRRLDDVVGAFHRHGPRTKSRSRYRGRQTDDA
jgi:hypothetical protein